MRYSSEKFRFIDYIKTVLLMIFRRLIFYSFCLLRGIKSIFRAQQQKEEEATTEKDNQKTNDILLKYICYV